MRRALVGLALCFATGAFAETPQKLKSVFGPGEQTTYEVSYVGIVAVIIEQTNSRRRR